MNYTFSGYCPTLEKDYQVSIDYLELKSLDGDFSFVKGLACCEFASMNHCSHANDCPIIKNAPEKL